MLIDTTFLSCLYLSTSLCLFMKANENGILQKTQEFVTALFRKNAHKEFPFHNYDHTAGVVSAATIIGQAEGLNDEELEIVLISAWMHDVGYFETYKGHEERGAEIARDFLEKNHYDQDKISSVAGCILATRFPQSPSNILESVICDADLAHLGRDHLESKVSSLRREWEVQCGEHYSDKEWQQKDLQFLRSHTYHTEYAQRVYGSVVKKRVAQIEAVLNDKSDDDHSSKEGRNEKTSSKKNPESAPDKTDSGSAESSATDSDELLKKLEKRKKKRKKLKKELRKVDEKLNAIQEEFHVPLTDSPETLSKATSARLDRGIETMFRTTSRNHIDLSSMADSKANIMISVNSIIISIIASFLPATVETDPQFSPPAVLLIAVSLVTIIFAILATRPKVTSGTFTQQDIKARKVNLLFFGNFHSVSLDDYEQGVTAMMNDAEYLYGAMIKDIYFLGAVLGKKYKYLRYSYNVFMYGLILAVLAFIVAATTA